MNQGSRVLLLGLALAGVYVTLTGDRSNSATTSQPPPGQVRQADSTAGAPAGRQTPELIMAVEAQYGPGSESPRADTDRNIRSIIAMVPDPVGGGFPNEFDFALGAIQRAAEQAAYVLQARHLPWLTAGGRTKPPAEPAGMGWLLFRREAPGSRFDLLAVPLVAERPASGFEADVLRAALDVTETLRGMSARGSASAETVSILGPTFSGTAESLRRALERWCGGAPGRCCERALQMVTGSATRRENASILRQTGGDFRSVRFHATVNADDRLAQAMRAFLTSLEFPYPLPARPPSIVELTESSTGFGQAHEGDPLRIAFPLNVADRRLTSGGALSSARGDARDGVPLLSPEGNDQVGLVMDNVFSALRRHGVSDVGIFASSVRDKLFLLRLLRETTPDVRSHVYEASLGLASEAQRKWVNGTVTVASYPLFISPQLKQDRRPPALQAFPSDSAEGIFNATLALLSRTDDVLDRALPDLLRDYHFAFDQRAALGPAVWISVVIDGQLWPLAAYPPQSLGPPHGTADDYVFASDRRSERRWLLDCPPGVPMVLAQVVIFVFMVGSLLGLVHACNAPAPEPAKAAAPVRERLQIGWQRLCWWTWRLLGRLGESLRRCPFLLVYQCPISGDCRSGLVLPENGEQRRALLSGLLVLAVTGIASAILCDLTVVLERGCDVFLPWRWDHPARALGFFTMLAGGGLLGFTTVALADGVFRRARGAPPFTARQLIAMFAIFVLFWGVVLVAPRLRGGFADLNAHGRALFLQARVTHPGLGLTPVLPLLIIVATYYVACVFRLRLLRRACALEDALAAWQSRPVGYFGRNVRMGFLCIARRRMLGSMLAGVAAGTLSYCWKGIRIRSLEGWWFDLLVSACFGMVFALILGSTLRAYRLCKKLRFHLHAISIHPVAAGLKRLPSFISRRFRTAMPGQIDVRELKVAERQWLQKLVLDKETPEKHGPATERTAELIEALEPDWGAVDLTSKQRPGQPRLLRENLVALRLSEILGFMCDITRTTTFIAAMGAIAAVLATGAYPFQPAGTLGWVAIGSVLLVVAVAGWVIITFERDEVLSCLAQTKPGEINSSWALAARVAGYVIVPLATVLATYLPNHTRLLDAIRELSKALER